MIPHRRGAAGRRRAVTAVADILAEFPVANTIDFRHLCDHISARRRRPIILIPLSTLPGARTPTFSGLWVGAATRDWVFYDDTAQPVTQRQAVLHEIGHITMGHRATGELDEQHLRLMTQVLPDVDPAALRKTARPGLCRSHGTNAAHYDEATEAEAEEFATELAIRLTPAHLITEAPPLHPGDRDIIDRFTMVFGPRGEPR